MSKILNHFYCITYDTYFACLSEFVSDNVHALLKKGKRISKIEHIAQNRQTYRPPNTLDICDIIQCYCLLYIYHVLAHVSLHVSLSLHRTNICMFALQTSLTSQDQLLYVVFSICDYRRSMSSYSM